MKIKSAVLYLLLFVCMSASSAWGQPMLVDWAFNDSGAIFTYWDTDPVDLPDHFDTSGFDWDTGLGNLNFSFEGEGTYSFIAFFDHEIVEANNNYFNEYGEAHGTPQAGQSWEIDEPGLVFGDIYDNVMDGELDNTNAAPSGLEEDLSLAIGWDFSLLEGESAMLAIILSDSAVTSSFYLSHNDPSESFFLGSSLEVNSSAAPVPEPGTIMLLAVGLLGMALHNRKSLLYNN